MRRRRRSIINISEQKEDLLEYFQSNNNIGAVYLYGSYGTPYQTPLSDLDIGMLTIKPITLPEELSLSAKVTEVLEEEDVNIVFLNKTNLLLQHRILSTGRLIYCSDQRLLADFIEKTAKLYCDFSIDLNVFNADYDQALKEVYLNA